MTNIQLDYLNHLLEAERVERTLAESERHNLVTEAATVALNEANIKKLAKEEERLGAETQRIGAEQGYTQARTGLLLQKDSYGNTAQDYALMDARYGAIASAQDAGVYFGNDVMELAPTYSSSSNELADGVVYGLKPIFDVIGFSVGKKL